MFLLDIVSTNRIGIHIMHAQSFCFLSDGSGLWSCVHTPIRMYIVYIECTTLKNTYVHCVGIVHAQCFGFLYADSCP